MYGFATLPWHHLHEMPVFWDQIIPDRSIPIIYEDLRFDNTQTAQVFELRVYKSPVHREGYKVSLYVSVREDPLSYRSSAIQLWSMFGRQHPDGLRSVSRRSFLYSFFFLLPGTTTQLTWKLISAVPAAHFAHGSPALTFSGYGADSPLYGCVVFRDARYERDGVSSNGGREVMPRRMSRTGIALGAYSAAVPKLENQSLTISYFL